MNERFSHDNGFTGRGLECRRGGRIVFSNLDFELKAGGALLLTGPNGSGKSSLLRMMAGLLKPSKGQLAFEGDGNASYVHYVGHKTAVKPALSVDENIRFWADHMGGQNVDDALAAFDLSHLAALPARYLSEGQQRRVALARLVASPRPLWLLDEPNAGLDQANMERLGALVTAHRARGGMVVAATHVALGFEGAVSLDIGADVYRPSMEEDALW